MGGGGNGAPQVPDSHYSSVVNIRTCCSVYWSLHVGKDCILLPSFRLYIYYTQFAFVYIFNLVIGVGALALPLAFSSAGLVLGTVLIVALAFMSYLTTSYVIEAMAAANAYDKFLEKRKNSRKGQLSHQSSDIQKADMVS